MHMNPVLTAVIMTLMVSAATAAPPSFCNGIDCPLWSNISLCKTPAGDTFEIRRYPSYKWVSYSITQYDYDGTTGHAFQHLFDYLQATGVKMTAPVLNDIQAGSGPNCNSTFVVSFFLDYVNQKNPPAVPSSVPGDFIQTYPPLVVAVRTFDGYANSWQNEVFPQLSALSQQVSSLGIQITPGREMVAAYDSPFNIIPQFRHNEVWLPIAGGIPASCAV